MIAQHPDSMLELAALLGIPIAEEYRETVIANYAQLLEQAALVMAGPLEDTADALRDFLQQVGATKPILVGHSIGGSDFYADQDFDGTIAAFERLCDASQACAAGPPAADPLERVPKGTRHPLTNSLTARGAPGASTAAVEGPETGAPVAPNRSAGPGVPWIEQPPPKGQIQVRFLSGPPEPRPDESRNMRMHRAYRGKFGRL